MPIVVKEASNTPLAVAALAKSMADTYSNYSANQMEQNRWDQEATWRKEDRDIQQAERTRLGDLATKLGGMDSSVFVGGEVGQLGAVNAAHAGNDFTSYLQSGTGYNPLDASSHTMEYMETQAYIRRQKGIDPPDPIADQRWNSMYNRAKPLKNQYGGDVSFYTPHDLTVVGSVDDGEIKMNPSARNITMPDGGYISAADIQAWANSSGKTVEQIIIELEKLGGR